MAITRTARLSCDRCTSQADVPIEWEELDPEVEGDEQIAFHSMGGYRYVNTERGDILCCPACLEELGEK